MRCAVQIDHGERPDLDPHGVDHQGIAFVMANGISIPGWCHVHGMRLIHAHAADFISIGIEDRDLVRLLEHLHSDICKNQRHAFRPTLSARVRNMRAAQLYFSVLLYDLCRLRFQNWIGVVADITVAAGRTVINQYISM